MTDLEFTDLLDPDFQRVVLALAVHDRDFYARARSILKPEYFTTAGHRAICLALHAFWDAQRDIPQELDLANRVASLSDNDIDKELWRDAIRDIFHNDEYEINRAEIEQHLTTFAMRAESAVAVGQAAANIQRFDIQKLRTRIEEIVRIPNLFGVLGTDVRLDWHRATLPDPRRIFHTGFADFDGYMRGGMREGDLVFFLGPMKRGKAERDDTPTLTPTGWHPLHTLLVGDLVIGANGKPTAITGVYPQGHRRAYRVHFDDGAYVDTDIEHLWSTTSREDAAGQRSKHAGPRDLPPRGAQIRTTKDIQNSLYCANQRGPIPNHTVQTVAPIAFNEQALPLEPYLLGALIGDGSFVTGTPTITSIDTGILNRITPSLPNGCQLKRQGRRPSYYISARDSGCGLNPVTAALRKLNLWGHTAPTKFIPESYLFGSIAQRTALLQGLMDTDGTVGKGRDGTHITYCTTSAQLADDVTALVRSLGGVTRISTRIPHFRYKGELRTGRKAYIVSVRLPNEIPPFSLTRKAKRVIPKTKRRPCRKIVHIENLGVDVPMRCIRVANPDGLFVTKDYIVTHNSMILINMGAGLMARGHNVVHYSLEMYELDVLKRYIACLSGVPTNELQQPGHLLTVEACMDEIARYTQAKVIIREWPGGRMTEIDLDSHLSNVEAEYGDVFVPVCDYMALMRPVDRTGDSWIDIPAQAVACRNLAKAHHVPFISAHQTTTEGLRQSRVDERHLAGARALGTVVEYAWSIDQDETDYKANRFCMRPFLSRHDRKDLTTYWRQEYEFAHIKALSETQFLALAPMQTQDDSTLPTPRRPGGKA